MKLLFLWFVLPITILKAQVVLIVDGEVKTPLTLTEADLSGFPRTTILAIDHDGKECHFEGVEISEILKMAGVVFGDSLRGKHLSKYLLVEGSDGYKVVFTLTEIDPKYTGRITILANKRDGQALSPKEGYRVVFPGEKKQSRWVRQVKAFHIKKSD